jgi:hypothetical protein
MYLGQASGAAIGQQVGMAATSKLTSIGASYLATTVGAGSMAGPIGTAVGVLVGLISMLFGGGVEKKPFYGLALLINAPRTVKPKFKNLIAAASHFTAISGNVPGPKDWNPLGVIIITEGGVPTSHATVAGRIAQIAQRQAELFAPFLDIFNRLPSDLQNKILETDLPLNPSVFSGTKGEIWKDAVTDLGKNAYYFTGSLPDKGKGAWTAWVISRNYNITSAVDIAYTAIARQLGNVLQKFGPEIESALSNPLANIIGGASSWFWLALIGGFLVLRRKNV